MGTRSSKWPLIRSSFHITVDWTPAPQEMSPSSCLAFFFLNIYVFILGCTGIRCCELSLVAASGNCSLAVVHGLFIAVASLMAEHEF